MFRGAGVFWCIYGGYLLVYSWFRPEGPTLVDIVPPMICVAYGLALYNGHRAAVWAGWFTFIFLLGGGAVSGLLNWPPFVVFLIAQAVLALYTTTSRKRLAND